ncbi:MAG: hypothetical protein O3B37_00650 [Proteobacteria bacterium]|nr:hypothetical protein [Pseudomonadota bacterium]
MAGRQGVGLQLLPPHVTQRSTIGFAAGVGVIGFMYLVAIPATFLPWHIAAAFLATYVIASGLTALLQARWRTA